MKTLITLIVILFLYSIKTIAQAPQAIPYQAVARDNSGNFVANQNISLRFDIHDATAGGTIVYKETQSATTNSLGLFTVNIGQGSVVTGIFSNINWGGGSKFLQVEIDVTGGITYVDMGTQQMLSVPYSLYSANSLNNTNSWNNNGNTGTNPATNFIGTIDNKDFIFKTNNIENLRISSAGTVGIGTASPVSLGASAKILQLSGSQFPQYVLQTTSAPLNSKVWRMITRDNVFQVQTLDDAFGNEGTAFQAKRNANSITDITFPNGNVGIGTSSPTLATLQVQGMVGNTVANFSGSANSKGVAIVSDDPGIYLNCYWNSGNKAMSASGYPSLINGVQSTGGGIAFLASSTLNSVAGGAVNTLERMRITGAGNVGIGTASPNGLLELSLDQARKPGTNTWTITSDARLKNIEGSYTKGLKEILQLQPITYHYKNVGERKFSDEVLNTLNVGFSAQDIQKIFPEAVGIDPDGYLNFNMHSILVAYVNAIKEQQNQIEELKTEKNNIQAMLEKIEKENDVLKTDITKIKTQLGMDLKAER